MMNTQEIQKNIPYSVVRECEEIAKASGESFRQTLEALYQKLYPKEINK